MLLHKYRIYNMLRSFSVRKKPVETGLKSTPGRIRTCNQRIRNPLLYPLSYGR